MSNSTTNPKNPIQSDFKGVRKDGTDWMEWIGWIVEKESLRQGGLDIYNKLLYNKVRKKTDGFQEAADERKQIEKNNRGVEFL